MIKSFARHAVTVTAALAAGGVGAVAGQAPAQASAFNASYTCNIGDLGQTAAVLDGWLTSPGTTYNGPARFQLHISSLNLQAPLTINSWSGAAWINVTGAENTTFQVTGFGGPVPAQGALAGDMAGDWAPAMAGTDTMSVGGIEISANSAEAGTVPVQCVPNGAPVAEVLQVASPYRGRWVHPPIPIFRVGGWYRPGMVLRRPVWRPGWNHPGWNRPGWNRPGWQHPGWNRPERQQPGWNRPGWQQPGANRPGSQQPGWNHPVPAQPGWNRPGAPEQAGGWEHPGGPMHHGGPFGAPYHH